jgi:hypothetical protein
LSLGTPTPRARTTAASPRWAGRRAAAAGGDARRSDSRGPSCCVWSERCTSGTNPVACERNRLRRAWPACLSAPCARPFLSGGLSWCCSVLVVATCKDRNACKTSGTKASTGRRPANQLKKRVATSKAAPMSGRNGAY